jgi:sulfonate transport system permease protein
MDKSKISFVVDVSANTGGRKLTSPVPKVITISRVLRLGSTIFILLLWEAFARAGLVESYILPAPSVVFQTLFSLLISGELLPHIYMSLFRALTGFFIGSILGILLGLVMGWSRFVENVSDIPFQVLRAIPKPALVPLFIVWFGLGEFPKILLISLTSFIQCTINTMAGVRSVDITMIKAARVLGAQDWQILKEIVIPVASPMIFAALRLGVVVSLVLLIIVEITGAREGLGYFIRNTQELFLIDQMFAGIITIAIFGYTMDWTIRKIQDRVLLWHRGIVAARI